MAWGYTDRQIEDLWDSFANVPFNEDEYGNEYLAVEWHIFEAGTDKMEIWHWFDEIYSKGIYGLVYDYNK